MCKNEFCNNFYNSYVSIKIYNSQGRLISNLVNQNQLKGKHKVQWSHKQANGFYICQLHIGDMIIMRKIIKIE